MKNITNLTELESAVGKYTVDKCSVEYLMIMTAKADRLDKLLSDLEEMKNTDMISCAELKQRLQQ